MIIQEIDGRPTTKQIVDAIDKYQCRHEKRLFLLNRLYRDKKPEVNKYSRGEEIPKLNFPIAKYITTIGSSYIIGREPTYKAAEFSGQDVIDAQIKEVLNLYRRQSMGKHDLSIRKQASKCGFAYEYVYLDPVSLLPKVRKLPELCTCVVFDNSIENDSSYGLYWNEFDDIFTVTVATADEIIEYSTTDLHAASKYIQISVKRHYAGRVPITLIRNNEELAGDYEGAAGLIEAFNDITTDERFDIKRTVDAILVFINTKLAAATEQEKRKVREAMKTLGILELPGNTNGQPVDVKPLSNPLNLSSTDVFVDRLWRAIFQLTMVPDPGRQEFYTAISGVALDMQMFMGLNQLAADVEPELAYALRRRMKMYVRLLSLRNIVQDFDTGDMEIGFNHTRPQNNMEVAQMIGMLYGKNIASNTTLADQLDFIKDPASEVDAARAENGQMNSDELIKQLSGSLPQVTG